MAEYDVEKILQDFGIVLSPEQQAKLESARMQNKRKAVAQEVPGDQPTPLSQGEEGNRVRSRSPVRSSS